MKPLALALALALPVAGLAAGIAAREADMAGSSEWRIQISGIDPRDPLRGQYVAFRYDWRVIGDPRLCAGVSCRICLEQGEPVIARAVPAGTACAHPVAFRGGAVRGRFGGRIFVSEASAPGVSEMLRRGDTVVVARLTRGGRLVNERLEPANGSKRERE